MAKAFYLTMWQLAQFMLQDPRRRELSILPIFTMSLSSAPHFIQKGKQLILVTSGAIGMGARELGLSKRVTEVRMRQACAAIGQPILMEEYRRAFGVFGLVAAQLLVTRDEWDDRASYLNLRKTVETLLEGRVIPVFNENDSVSTAEIGNAFGDNDRLSAYVASKIDAELLIMLSDVDSLYDADPRENPAARRIPYVRELSEMSIWLQQEAEARNSPLAV